MTKKDYVKIADELVNAKVVNLKGYLKDSELWWYLIDKLGEVFEKDNPKYSHQQFVDYINSKVGKAGYTL